VAAPKTVSAAARRASADLALVSTPGRVAAVDAADALSSGLDVMIFSDNVSVQHEVALKDLAAAQGRLVMGPDCGTAVVGGVGLGFANVVRPGPVGIVAASGTGAQHLLSLLDGAGIGVAHCLGVGGRDLSREVAGRSTVQAVGRLAADPDIEVIVLVSKPPAADVAERVTAAARRTGKRVVVGYLGPGQRDLTATAEAVARELEVDWRPPQVWGEPRPGTGPFLRGLYSGGSLCDEAMVIVAAEGHEVASNIPLEAQPALDDTLTAHGHTFIDFGDDRLTVGRPHPMIDSSLRVERLQRELTDPDCGAVLLDVVLGHAANPDPAADLLPAIEAASTPVVVALVGTRDDPQGRDRTAERLAEAGAWVHASNASATRGALSLIAKDRT
jgi:FdrA protein